MQPAYIQWLQHNNNRERTQDLRTAKEGQNCYELRNEKQNYEEKTQFFFYRAHSVPHFHSISQNIAIVASLQKIIIIEEVWIKKGIYLQCSFHWFLSLSLPYDSISTGNTLRVENFLHTHGGCKLTRSSCVLPSHMKKLQWNSICRT